MNNEGSSLLSLVITIIILIAIAGVGVFLTVGEEGIITQAGDEQIKYNETEVLEQLNSILTQKYIDDYHKESGNNMDKYYNNEEIIKFLMENKYIEDYYEVEKEEKTENKYYILVENLKANIKQYGFGKNGNNGGNGKDLFFLQKEDSKFFVYYITKDGESEEIGELEVQKDL